MLKAQPVQNSELVLVRSVERLLLTTHTHTCSQVHAHVHTKCLKRFLMLSKSLKLMKVECNQVSLYFENEAIG